MPESESIQATVYEAAIQAATVLMMALSDADAGPQPATTASLREPQRQRHGRPALERLHSTGMTRTGILNYLILRWRSQTFLKQKHIC